MIPTVKCNLGRWLVCWFRYKLYWDQILLLSKHWMKNTDVRGPTQKKRTVSACNSFYLTNSGNQLGSPSK